MEIQSGRIGKKKGSVERMEVRREERKREDEMKMKTMEEEEEDESS